MSAIGTFKTQESNIRYLLQAADVYTQHLISGMRQQPADQIAISKIIGENCMSVMNFTRRLVITDSEHEQLRSNGQTKKICEEIVMSVYTAVEQYLINKFKEHLHQLLSSQSSAMREAIDKRVSFRSLDQIKENYREFFGVNVVSIAPNFICIEDCWFQPNSAWEGVVLLSKARNEIAHDGTSKSFNIFYLLDAFAPLNFASSWIHQFDFHFESFVLAQRPAS